MNKSKPHKMIKIVWVEPDDYDRSHRGITEGFFGYIVGCDRDKWPSVIPLLLLGPKCPFNKNPSQTWRGWKMHPKQVALVCKIVLVD